MKHVILRMLVFQAVFLSQNITAQTKAPVLEKDAKIEFSYTKGNGSSIDLSEVESDLIKIQTIEMTEGL